MPFSRGLPDPGIKHVPLSLMHWQVGSLPLMPLIFSSSHLFLGIDLKKIYDKHYNYLLRFISPIIFSC